MQSKEVSFYSGNAGSAVRRNVLITYSDNVGLMVLSVLAVSFNAATSSPGVVGMSVCRVGAKRR